MDSNYIFTSERLGFRNWREEDIAPFAQMNKDTEVMRHFPKTLTTQESTELIDRLKKHYIEHGYTYYAVEVLTTGELIGFIGIAYQDYETPFTPATDIGWRLKTSAWGKGYATEGALKCLEFAFNELHLSHIVSVCTENNTSSENVMKKIGMTKKGIFKHSKLKDYPALEKCLWYEIMNPLK